MISGINFLLSIERRKNDHDQLKYSNNKKNYSSQMSMIQEWPNIEIYFLIFLKLPEFAGSFPMKIDKVAKTAAHHHRQPSSSIARWVFLPSFWIRSYCFPQNFHKVFGVNLPTDAYILKARIQRFLSKFDSVLRKKVITGTWGGSCDWCSTRTVPLRATVPTGEKWYRAACLLPSTVWPQHSAT